MKIARWLLLSLLLSLVLLGSLQKGAFAADHPEEEEEEDEDIIFEEEDDMEDEDTYEADEVEDIGSWEVVPNDDVTTNVWFPEYPEKVFPLGKPIDIIVNLYNQGRQTFNVSYVQVAFRSPYDLSYYIQNFTARTVDTLLSPQQQLNVEYTFMPEPTLDPTKFWMTGYVGFNNTAGRGFRNVWANSTVEMVAGDLKFDLTITLQYLLLLALAGAGVWFYLTKSAAGAGKPKKAAAAAAAATSGKKADKTNKDSEDAVSSGWENLVYQPEKESKSVRRRNPTKKSK